MVITKETISHLAELSRLKLSASEAEKYRQELSAILEYIEQLQEVDTAGVEPTAQVSGLVGVGRNDEARDWDREEIMAALGQGELENGQVKVKRIM